MRRVRSEGRSLLFQDDPQFLVGRFRVFPFRHLYKTALVGFLPPGFPTLRQAAQKEPPSVFHFVYREQARQFARLLSSLLLHLPRAVSVKSKIDAGKIYAFITITYVYTTTGFGKRIAQ